MLELLHRPPLLSRLGCKPPLRPYVNYYLPILSFVLFFSGCNLAHVLYTVPYMPSAYAMAYGINLAFVAVMFLCVALIRPYVKRSKGTSLYELYKAHDPGTICPDCVCVRPYRSRHCQCCNRCVRRFDHHCPWVNNCVGEGNHGYFLAFILSIFILLIMVIIPNMIFVAELFGNYDTYGWPAWMLLVLFCALFFALLFNLISMQICNFFMNRTTSERFSKSRMTEKYIRMMKKTGPCGNFRIMCCNLNPFR
jgi:palmitoyltransferase